MLQKYSFLLLFTISLTRCQHQGTPSIQETVEAELRSQGMTLYQPHDFITKAYQEESPPIDEQLQWVSTEALLTPYTVLPKQPPIYALAYEAPQSQSCDTLGTLYTQITHLVQTSIAFEEQKIAVKYLSQAPLIFQWKSKPQNCHQTTK